MSLLSKSLWIFGILASSLSAQFFNCSAACHVVSGSAYDGAGGPFLPGHVYLVQGGLSVPTNQTLTIGAGAILKFSYGWGFYVNGTLVVNATAGSPVIATTITDDIGGDHNGDGAASAPGPGGWSGFVFAAGSSASQCTNLLVRYAGSNSAAAVFCHQGVTPTFVGLRTVAPLAASLDLSNSSAPTVMNANFQGGTKACTNVPLAAVAGFSGCVSTGQSVYRDLEVSGGIASGSATVAFSNSFNGSGVVIVPGQFFVGSGATLTLGAGVILKWATPGWNLGVDGTLLTQGTQTAPVVATSIYDDAHGGDTNLDGTNTAPAAGQWAGVLLTANSNGSLVEGLLVRCAAQALRLFQSNCTLRRVRTELVAGAALDLSNNSTPTVVDCAWNGGTYAATNVLPIALAGFRGCTANGNTLANAPRITAGTIGAGATVRIGLRNSFNLSGAVHLGSDLVVSSGATLEIGRGVVLKSEAQGLSVFGTAHLRGTGGEPVVLTSVHDDAFGGDSNGNGSATLPAPYQCSGVRYFAGSGGSAAHLRVRYGGAAVPAAIVSDTAAVSFGPLRADASATMGIWLQGAQNTALDNLVAWNCVGTGIRFDGPQVLRHATVSGCGAVGIRNGVSAAGPGSAVNCISWNNTGGGFASFAAGAVTSSNGPGAGGANLNVDPQFTAPLAGDLTLQSTSPCLDAGDLLAGYATVTDHVEGSRLSDGRLVGTPYADLGAYESCVYRLSVIGQPWSQGGLIVEVDGPPGTVALGVSTSFVAEPYIPHGFLTIGPLSSVLILGLVPPNTPLVFPLGDLSALAGIEVGMQALGAPAASPGLGAFSNRWRGVIDG